MGANQSRPSDAAVNEKLRERLQALHVNEERSTSEKDGFVHIAGDARKFLNNCVPRGDF
jgi:bleomycin hydrolase